MRDITITPKGRDRQAMLSYKIMDWMCRRNKHIVRKMTHEAMMDYYLYGGFEVKGFSREN